jgi:hypothetical protein
MIDKNQTGPKQGVCFPWEEKRKELGRILGDEDLLRKIWEDTDALAYVYIWHCLLSF